MIYFICLSVGGCIGLVVAALCNAVHNADQWDEMRRFYEEGREKDAGDNCNTCSNRMVCICSKKENATGQDNKLEVQKP